MSNNSAVVQPLLTDFYQITMAYAYWKAKRVDDLATFELYFRKNPFDGEFTIFGGLADCLDFVQNFHITDGDIDYLKQTMSPSTDPDFFVYLRQVTATDVTIWAIDEGSVVFPQVPLLCVEGPLITCQLLETTLLNLVNFPSLVATNAARLRLAAGKSKLLLEFGLRRAQGPDGALTASKYAYMGGFDASSNVLAGKLFDIPIRGTHAHSFVTSFTPALTSSQPQSASAPLRRMMSEVSTSVPLTASQPDTPVYPLDSAAFIDVSIDWLRQLAPLLGVSGDCVQNGELTAFANYAVAFPDQFVALVDTYDVLK